MEIVKKCEWCHKTFIGQMVTARFCSSKCCDQAYRYKRKVQSGKYTPADSNIDLSTLSRRVDERKHFNDTLKDKQFLSPSEAAKLLGVCRSTIYNYLALQELRAKQFRGVNDNVKVCQKIIQKYTTSTECCKGTKSLLYITYC